ncbi:hypothetical protein E1091_11125 [Micromonospora fluostatini]|uniref:DUF222 domain-containing protein n=1 Tax=Micromonospora fluostatini TaxID=1629071 RepID=A0ABY2DH53_9ACTN|nr:hypothetical protein E1091_11125 [Micromonospora fluostatini]
MNDLQHHPRTAGLARLLSDLDRCPHGRHEGDICHGWEPSRPDAGCEGGISLGNPHVPTGKTLGYTYGGQAIVMPERGQRADPVAWTSEVDGEYQPSEVEIIGIALSLALGGRHHALPRVIADLTDEQLDRLAAAALQLAVTIRGVRAIPPDPGVLTENAIVRATQLLASVPAEQMADGGIRDEAPVSLRRLHGLAAAIEELHPGAVDRVRRGMPRPV